MTISLNDYPYPPRADMMHDLHDFEGQDDREYTYII